jgi:hypothetical protein
MVAAALVDLGIGRRLARVHFSARLFRKLCAFFGRGKHSFTLGPANFSYYIDSKDEFRSPGTQNNSNLTMFPQKDFIPRR